MLHSKQSSAFLAVAETGSFELAAEQLCITASAVSLRVQTLEKDLGQILILRERPCRVTQAGQEVLLYLQHMRLLQQNLLHKIQGKSSSAFYQLNVATNADSLATWFLPAISQMLKTENITLNLKIADQTQTLSLLESGLVNACISTESETIKGCKTHLLGKMTYRMVATADFYKKWLSLGVNRSTLRTAPAVIFNSHDHLHHQVILQHFGLTSEMYPFHFIPSSHAFFDAIMLDLGFGMLPEFQINDHISNGNLIEIIPAAKTDVLLYWHCWENQSIQLEKLSQMIVLKTQEILQKSSQ